MLIKGFIPPFAVSFLMALFVLVMQVFWLYIDDILGKGAGILVILEFLFYLSFSLTPLALPIGVLMAGVFLFGNLAERYELSSMKSSGISLIRIMLPAIVLAFLVSIFSWVCSDYIIPRSNLKYVSRLHDLKRQKPTLGLDEAIFNEDFYGYTIRIKDKNANGRDINDILIYDHSNTEAAGEKTIITAKTGTMFVTPQQKCFVMILYNGIIYQDPGNNKSNNSNLPFIRTEFKELTKVFDLSEFTLDRSDEDLFKNDKRMKNSQQLRTEIDSITSKLNQNKGGTFRFIQAVFDRNRQDSEQTEQTTNFSYLYSAESLTKLDSLILKWDSANLNLFEELTPKVINNLEIISNQKKAENDEKRIIRVQKAKFEYELYIKYSFAAVCLLFIFIGAPLGAIIRKGGYGYPLIICILVFIVYILLNTFCKKLTEGLRIPTIWAAWLPCIILTIPAIFLTWSALKDRNALHDIRNFFKTIFKNK